MAEQKAAAKKGRGQSAIVDDPAYIPVLGQPTEQQVEIEKAATIEPDDLVWHGAVFYTDGGARPNPGACGYGFHGYYFGFNKPKKGTGNPDHILTSRGYVEKATYNTNNQGKEYKYDDSEWEQTTQGGKKALSLEVTPLTYIDGYGALGIEATNNVGELAAAAAALQYIADYDIDYVLMILDSRYVLDGITDWVRKWVANGWVKQDGLPVANKAEWLKLMKLRDDLVARGVQVEFSWIKGHSDQLGNDKADKLATIGVFNARRQLDGPQRGSDLSYVEASDAQGYWKYDTGKHPLLYNRRMYFNTESRFITPGLYFLGDLGKQGDDFFGKANKESAMSIVRLGTPDPILEMIRAYQSTLAQNINTLAMARLDCIFSAETHRDLSQYGELPLNLPNKDNLDLFWLGKEPITKELRPPFLAFRGIEILNTLSRRLDQYLANDPEVVCTDLTGTFYDVVEKTSKNKETTTFFKLKDHLNVGLANLTVDAHYKNGDELALAPIKLTMGIDLPDRNTFRRLEEMVPKVTLITWMESSEAFRYAVIIETSTDNSYGIWAGPYSNLRTIV